MDLLHSRWSLSSGVSPFRDLRVNGYLLLTAAFRSLSRLSSAPSAKASALCPCSLDLFEPVPGSRMGRLAYLPRSFFSLDLHFHVSFEPCRFKQTVPDTCLHVDGTG